MRAPMTSRSNCAEDDKTFKVGRPIEVVVLNLPRDRNKERAARIGDLYDLGEIGK